MRPLLSGMGSRVSRWVVFFFAAAIRVDERAPLETAEGVPRLRAGLGLEKHCFKNDFASPS